MHAFLFESLDARWLLSGGAVHANSFDDDWKKAQAILSGEAFVAWGDANEDRKLTFAEQFAHAKPGDANNDGAVDLNDLRVPDRSRNGTIGEALKYMDHVDWYEAKRVNGAHAWLTADGTLAISGSGKMSLERSGDTNLKYVENGTQLARFSARSVKRIEVFGSGRADAITVGRGVDKPIVIYARGGNDTVHGGDRGETIHGGGGSDQLHGGGGDDQLFGFDDADRLWGDAGNDRLEGGGGKDTLDGGRGTDRLAGGGSADVLTLQARDKDKRDNDRNDKVTILK